MRYGYRRFIYGHEPGQTIQQVGVSVLNIAKTQSEQQGQDLVKMLQSVQPHLGGNLYIRI
ncbi:hypothetical protein B7C51_14650 [Paenibacillus larvae subsp. pulvifaciens]|uniref:Uncharacterized protein n=1 Tax=Paenibacillus larvae subsp. pulvifaciens TaxID=1477 RepID=A0A1V0UUX4_9BACL|nr:YjfB family protein [Paenibacillus larvae]ARF68768.1 hypothetical protein B7C51_14650 [Paenibacillus larvae subsp. pulvifaciens]